MTEDYTGFMDEAGTDHEWIRILLVFKDDAVRELVREKLESYFPNRSRIVSLSSISEAIEKLEATPEVYQLALIEQAGQGVILLRAILGVLNGAVIGVLTEHPETLDALKEQDRPLETIDRRDVIPGLYLLLKKSVALGRLPAPEFKEQEEFVSIGIESISGLSPLQNDIYARIRKDHYVCVFKKGSTLEETDLKKFIDSNRTEFHVKVSEIKNALHQVSVRLEGAAKDRDVSMAQANQESVATHSLLRDVVVQLGFTPEAQAIAKSCVNMALKALGSKPKLNEILEDLKSKEGTYIPAHSFMVGNVACAIAHRIGWSSNATFFKLSLAAFLHDISLKSEIHAKLRDLSSAHQEGLEGEEIKLIKLHPLQASEYSKQFSEIPSDVDIIISQHHESPVGDGFPKGMPGKLISPLSALFIMAQDLVDAVLDHPETKVEDFFKANASRYEVGQFRKIVALILK
jgi:HD-GYP domain-containing protein (c-di-GMP phosphodiesterase class II)